MATLEQEHISRPIAAPEAPVFVAGDGRRARALRLVAAATAVIALLWLVALAAGMLGFGTLPGVANPIARFGKDKAGTPPADRGSHPAAPFDQSTSRRATLIVEGGRHFSRQATQTRAGAGASAQRRSRPQPAAPSRGAPPAVPQPAPQPLPAQQGWARRGWTAPPGRARRAQVDTPPPPGQATAPGQAKKALTPPPPPPPPPGNGNGGGPKKP